MTDEIEMGMMDEIERAEQVRMMMMMMMDAIVTKMMDATERVEKVRMTISFRAEPRRPDNGRRSIQSFARVDRSSYVPN